MMTKENTRLPPKQNDALLKAIFEENFPDFLQFLYADAAAIFDLDKGIEFMDKELLTIAPNRDEQKGKRIADLLTKVFLQDGTERWILVHTEIEAGSQEDFAFRMFQYYYRILDRYKVPVESIAVYTGNKNQSRPSQFLQQVIDTRTCFDFRSYHIFDHTEQDLLTMDNIFTLIVLACQKALREGKVAEEELGEDRLNIVKALLKHQYGHDRIKSFLLFLINFLYVEDQKINEIFYKQIEELSEKEFDMGVIEVIKKQERKQGMKQGMEKGIEQGRKQAVQKSREVIEKLIIELKLTDQEAARIAREDVDFVRKVRKELNQK